MQTHIGVDTDDVDLAAVGALLGEPARARILLALADGRALPASLLAAEAGVAKPTASGHLGRLVDGGLLRVEQSGRHRYYRLAGPDVAEIIERLSLLAPRLPVRSLASAGRARAVRDARLCYDHLAGRLGVDLVRSFLEHGLLDGHDGSFRPGVDQLSSRGTDVSYELTSDGRSALAEIGVVTDGFGRRAPIRHCVDWSEQRHHLSGALGAAVAERFFALGWIERAAKGRAVRVTPKGQAEVYNRYGVASDGCDGRLVSTGTPA
jgi:DNA-binding transcriptional ArsR family regulator